MLSPIKTIGMIVSVRAWLAFFYTSITEITGFESNILNWLTIFVIGVIPDVPDVFNVVLFVLLNGSLILFTTLYIKHLTRV